MEPAAPPAAAPAVRCAGHERGYPELLDRAARIATGLSELGVGPGDRVAVVLRNEPAHLEITAAAAQLGACAVPVNWHFHQDDLRHVLTDSGSAVVFAHTDLLPAVTAVLPEGVPVVEVPVPPGVAVACGLPAPPATGRHPLLDTWLTEHPPLARPVEDRPPTVIYSSGTTGRPKGVLREPVGPERLAEAVAGFLEYFAVPPGGRTLIPAPLYHAAPSQHAALALAAGLDITLMPRFDAEEFLRLVERYGIQQTQMVPTMFVRLLRLPKEVRERYDLSSLTSVVHAAAPCPPHIKHAMIDWLGPVLREYYGGSETGAVTWCDSAEWLARPGTVGRAQGTCAVAVLGPEGQVLPPGATGEVYVRPADLWPRFSYLGHPDARAAMEAPGLPGYVTLGDLGHLDEDGYLYLSDRRADLVISGGVNIYPAEIEGCLLALDGVRDAAVFGVPDEEYGEALAAHLETDPRVRLTAAAVRAHVAGRLAGYKVPRTVVFEERLPRDESGKLFKRRLRDPYWDGHGRRI
ncbi:long-chain fatty acid--CoA ligase [Streptomyces sp. NRRL F-4489]|uniref:AMP-binding protein n=1 Tax=Streptomyces sp. NRRL F-4489 TaxID=1609095 RepID=UPI00074803AB|nr:AMP-binding protein [Streptomyces sp. NRRL F-4489]KUL37237.1 long-chain fatty acid--CoA ligase [Streptomyces sp. NRRL F-4489]